MNCWPVLSANIFGSCPLFFMRVNLAFHFFGQMVLLQWSCWLSLVCTVVLSRFQIAMSKREKFFQSRGVQVLCLPTYYTHKRQQQQQLSPPQSSDYSSNKVDSQPTTTIIHFICGKQSKVQLFPFGTPKNKTFKIVCHKP